MQRHTIALHGGSALLDDLDNLGVEGVAKGHMTDKAALEEGEWANALCAVDDLVRDHKVHGLDLLLQGAYSAEGNDAADTNVSQSGNVGASGNLVRCILVVCTVAGKESDRNAIVLEDENGGGWLTPRRLGVQLCDGGVAVDLVETGTANDGNVDRACRRSIVRFVRLFQKAW